MFYWFGCGTTTGCDWALLFYLVYPSPLIREPSWILKKASRVTDIYFLNSFETFVRLHRQSHPDWVSLSFALRSCAERLVKAAQKQGGSPSSLRKSLSKRRPLGSLPMKLCTYSVPWSLTAMAYLRGFTQDCRQKGTLESPMVCLRGGIKTTKNWIQTRPNSSKRKLPCRQSIISRGQTDIKSSVRCDVVFWLPLLS